MLEHMPNSNSAPYSLQCRSYSEAISYSRPHLREMSSRYVHIATSSKDPVFRAVSLTATYEHAIIIRCILRSFDFPTLLLPLIPLHLNVHASSLFSLLICHGSLNLLALSDLATRVLDEQHTLLPMCRCTAGAR